MRFRREMLSFARGEGRMVAGDLNAAVEEAIELVHTRLKYLEVEIKYGSLPAVRFSQAGIKHIFANILTNASESIRDEKGRISVSTYEEEGFAVVSISDNGEGMENEQLDKILEGKSTKHEGKGIGTQFCRYLIDKHNGEISYQSRRGEGTKVYVRLPISQEDQEGSG
jgi:signal transduction histidine kinase